MRLAADKDSPYWSPLALRAFVLYNGLRIANVVEADEEAGIVRFFMTGPNARPFVRRRRSEWDIPIVTARGAVKIVIPAAKGTM